MLARTFVRSDVRKLCKSHTRNLSPSFAWQIHLRTEQYVASQLLPDGEILYWNVHNILVTKEMADDPAPGAEQRLCLVARPNVNV